MSRGKTKEEYNAYMREYNRKNPDARRNVDFKRTYGITVTEYNEILLSQQGVCAICSKPETSIDHRTKQIRNLAVDHCHSSGKVRGLLCSRCNVAMGQLKDDITVLQSAISYLQRSDV
jgi:hypothetical protein